MLTQHECPAFAPAAVNGAPRKLRQLLRKRLRQLLRVTFVLAIGLALGATALAIWWLTSLNRLPDVGDPFDVAAFRALRMPDDQNAFTFLRRANQKLTPWPELQMGAVSAPTDAWSKLDPKIRAWVEANRQALELFQRGAEQADAVMDLTGDASAGTDCWTNGLDPLNLSELALFEGGKRQESGDTAGAWDCFRAVLRMTAHFSRRGSWHQYHDKLACRWLGQRLATWAADPRTTVRQLETALDEVLEAEPRPAWDAFALKVGYLELMNSLERPMPPLDQQEIEGEWTYRLGDMQLSTDNIGCLEAACRFLLREPERSRRVVRLLCANYLAHLQNRAERTRTPVVQVQPIAFKPISVPLYPVGSDAPAGARALPPRELAGWLVATRDAKLRIQWARIHDGNWPPNRLAYRRVHRELVIMLATELYRRERGALPPSEEALIGTYLKSLPDGGLPWPIK
jgi:hypothetical protein